MADSSAAKPLKRLSVWAATEPLLAPLPPPPRIQRIETPAAPLVESHMPHPVPPPPHVPQTDAVQEASDVQPATPSTQQQTLRLPSLVASFAITAILLAAIGWFQAQEPSELGWHTVRAIVLGQSIEPVVPESELPYVTVMPLLANYDNGAVVERNVTPSKRAQQVTMNNIKPVESPVADSATEPQRR